MTDLRKAAEMALSGLETIRNLLQESKIEHAENHASMIEFVLRQALAQPEQEPVAWLQFKDKEPPVVAPRNLGTPVFLGIRGGLAHDTERRNK